MDHISCNHQKLFHLISFQLLRCNQLHSPYCRLFLRISYIQFDIQSKCCQAFEFSQIYMIGISMGCTMLPPEDLQDNRSLCQSQFLVLLFRMFYSYFPCHIPWNKHPSQTSYLYSLNQLRALLIQLLGLNLAFS